jgi:hypothetical protein
MPLLWQKQQQIQKYLLEMWRATMSEKISTMREIAEWVKDYYSFPK